MEDLKLEKLFSVEDIKNYTRLSYDSIRKYIREGKIKAKKMGVRYLVKESDLIEFIESQSKKTAR